MKIEILIIITIISILNTAKATSPNVVTACEINLFKSECIFTNRESDTVKVCAKVEVINNKTKESSSSVEVCPGEIKGNTTANAHLIFENRKPFQICLGNDPLGKWEDCKTQIHITKSVFTDGGWFEAVLWFALAGFIGLFASKVKKNESTKS